MLNISSASWHFRMRSRIFDSPPKDLCSYFWSCVAAAVALGVIAIGRFFLWVTSPLRSSSRAQKGLGIVLYVILGCMLLLLFGLFVYNMITDFWDTFLETAKIIGLVVGVIVGGILFLLALAGIGELNKHYGPKKKPEASGEAEEKPRQPQGESGFSVLWNFLKAKKRKACPIISVDGIDPRRPLVPSLYEVPMPKEAEHDPAA